MAGCEAARGYSVLEVIFVTALIVTLSGIALPQTVASLDDFRAAGAARYVSSRLYRARMLAVMRSTSVAIQFSRTPAGYSFTEYQDGNGNGVLTSDIKSGIDRRVGLPESLRDNFRGIDFGALPGLPPIDPAGTPPGDDPIRLGAGSILTFTAHGSSSTGTVYIRGRDAQYAVRIFGDTGKSRMLKFDHRAARWRQI
jgi:type II secretory pathway pseudopilin PulG